MFQSGLLSERNVLVDYNAFAGIDGLADNVTNDVRFKGAEGCVLWYVVNRKWLV